MVNRLTTPLGTASTKVFVCRRRPDRRMLHIRDLASNPGIPPTDRLTIRKMDPVGLKQILSYLKGVLCQCYR